VYEVYERRFLFEVTPKKEVASRKIWWSWGPRDMRSFCATLYKPKLDKSHGFVLKYNKSMLIKWGKAIPVQAWTGPKGSRRLRFPDFKNIDS